MTKLIWITAALGISLTAQTPVTTDINGATQSPAATWPVINANFNSLKSAAITHNARTDNPHATTAAQTNAIPNIGTTPGDVLFLGGGNVWTRLPSPDNDGFYCWHWVGGIPSYSNCQSSIASTVNLLSGDSAGGATDSGISPATVVTAASALSTGNLLKGLGGRAVGLITLGGAGTVVPSIIGTPTVGDCAQFDTGLAITTAGAPCGGVGGSPTGAATGDLTGTYPAPTIGAGKVTLAQIATAAKSGAGAKLQTTDASGVSGHTPVYDAGGTLIDSGVTPGGLPAGGSACKILGYGTVPLYGGLTGYDFDGTNWVPNGTVFPELNATSNPFVKIQAPVQTAGPTLLTAASTITCDRWGKAVYSASDITLVSVPNITGVIAGDLCQITNTGNYNITLQCNTVQADSQVVCPGGGTTIVISKWQTIELKRSSTLTAWTVVGPSSSAGPGSGLLLPSPAATGLSVVTDSATGTTVARTLTGGNGITFTNGSGVAGNPTIVVPGTAKGDSLWRNVSGNYVALPVSATGGDTIVVDSSTATGVKWATPAASIATVKGDIATSNGSVPTALAVGGTDGMLLQVASGQATGMQWVAPTNTTKVCKYSGASTQSTVTSTALVTINLTGLAAGGMLRLSEFYSHTGTASVFSTRYNIDSATYATFTAGSAGTTGMTRTSTIFLPTTAKIALNSSVTGVAGGSTGASSIIAHDLSSGTLTVILNGYFGTNAALDTLVLEQYCVEYVAPVP